MPIAKEISDMLDIGQKPLQVFSAVYFTSKIAKIEQDNCSHCGMSLDYCFNCYQRSDHIERSLSGYTPCVYPVITVGDLNLDSA